MRLYSVFDQLRDFLIFFRGYRRQLSLGFKNGTSIFEGLNKTFLKLAEWSAGHVDPQNAGPAIITVSTESPSGGLSSPIGGGYYAEANFLTYEFNGITTTTIYVEFPFLWFSRLSGNLNVLETKVFIIFGLHIDLVQSINLNAIPPGSSTVSVKMSSMELSFLNHETGAVDPVVFSIPQGTSFNTLSVLHADVSSTKSRHIVGMDLGIINSDIENELVSKKSHMDSAGVKAKLHIDITSNNLLNVVTFPVYIALFARLGAGVVYTDESNYPDSNSFSINFSPFTPIP